MIKRASTILLTLFLLLSSAQVWAQSYVPNVVVAETSFESSTGAYPCKLSEIKCKNPSNESYNTPLSYVVSPAPSMNGTYTIFDGTLIIKHDQKDDKNVLLTGNISGLVSASGYNDYKIIIELDKGGDYQVRCKTNVKETDKSPGETIEAPATAVGGSVSFSLYFNWINSGTLRIKSIKVVGYSEKKIISSESPAVCSGKETTLSALGASGSSYQWYVSDDDVNYTPIPGATKSTYTVTVSEKKFYKLNDIKGLLVYPVLCCSDNSSGSPISERFQMTTTAKAFEALPSEQIDGAYTHASSSPIKDGKYAIVHKAKDGGYWDNSPVEAKDLRTDSKDGFLLVNCSKDDHGKAMYKRRFDRLCPNTLYKFSAAVSSLSMVNGDLGIDVKFDVIAIGGTNNNQSLLPEPISVKAPSMSTSWIEKNISFVTKGCTSVEVRLYNNVENPKATGGNDVGIDDIVFGLCTPEIALYSNDAWSEKDREVCPDDEPNTYIHVGSAMNLDDILPGTKWYYYEYLDGTTWKPVAGTNPTKDNKFKVSIAESTHSSGVLYRAWIAGDETIVVKAAKGQIVAGTCTSYAQSDAIKLTYKCENPCTPTNKPVTKDFRSCETTGTATLYDKLLKSPTFSADKYVWEKYKADGTTSAVSSTTFDTSDENASGKYRVQSIKHVHTDGVEYCASDWADATITISSEIKITLLADGEEYGPNDEYKICKGKSAKLIAQVESGTQVKWTATPADPVIDVTTTANPYITITPEEKTIYTANSSDPASCYKEGKITVNVIELEKPVIGVDKESICKGSKVNMGVSYVAAPAPDVTPAPDDATGTTPSAPVSPAAETGIKYTWYFSETNSSDISSWTKLSGTNADMLNYEPEKTGYYKLEASIGECVEISEEIKVTVGNEITFKVSANPTVVCEGGSTYIKMTEYPTTAGTTIQWYEGTDTSDENGVKIGEAGEDEVNVTPTKEKNKYTASVKNLCEATKTITITVDEAINSSISGPAAICKGESITINASGGDIKWLVDNQSIGTGSSINVKPEETTTYTANITKGKCSDTKTVEITVNSLPEINNVSVKEDEENESVRYIEIDITGGQAPYYYSLDGENFDGPNIIPSNVPIGWNLLYVKDENECKGNKQFYVAPIDIIPEKFFTPNGDGNNEEWNVEKLDLYDSYIVEIFDRHGKRLFIQKVGSFNTGGNTVDGDEFTGWDGMYNGHPMPSDDYWYLITVEEIRKQYTGHFTLKR
ncbi:MAG: T9SS type B sorting domain-containing protein [Paludibacteraceae bacterium]|nr:T9SS type B sorting domain-containing protein [Paludibacteraceae bacterium]